MIKNRIHYVSRSEAAAVKKSLDQSIFVVELNGKEIQSDDNYLRWVWEAFKFPYPDEKPSWSGYDDWIRDMNWIDADGFALFIYNFAKFMKKDERSKTAFVAHFQDFILPFWEDEVTWVFVGGKAKLFNVYLVE